MNRVLAGTGPATLGGMETAAPSMGMDAGRWAQEPELERLCAGHAEVLLYGSVARGDANLRSDVDVLVLGPRGRAPVDLGRISLTVYTEEHLRALARKGSLFLLHLRQEGRVLRDPRGVFRDIFGDWVPPDTARVREGMRAASAVLDSSKDDACDPRARQRVALYLLRSVLYLRCLELGDPVFAMDRVAVRLGDERIAALYSRRTTQTLDQRLRAALVLLDQYLPDRRSNPFGSLEALAVSWHTRFPMAADLAIRILTSESRIDYTSAPVDWGDQG